MKFGVTAYIWAAEFTTAQLGILPRLRERGFDGVEIPVFRPEAFDAAPIRSGLVHEGMQCEVSAALVSGLSLASEDADVRRRTIAHITRIVEAGLHVTRDIAFGRVRCRLRSCLRYGSGFWRAP